MIDLARLRGDFPLLVRPGRPVIYMDHAATSLKPRAVVEAVRGYLEDYPANVHRGQHALSERASEAYEAARLALARLIGARASELVLVRGTTEAINLVAAGLRLAPGDNVVVTLLEHHSNILPWASRCEVRAAPLLPSGLPDLAAAEALVDHRTRALAVSACSNVTGARVPIAAWAAAARRCRVPLLVDAAQAVAHGPLDVEELGCDYLALSGHKMFGPPGCGALWGRREALERLDPPGLGGGAAARVRLDLTYDLRELPWRLEGGTPDIAAAIGLGAAATYLEAIGMDAIAAREEALAALLDAEVATLPELRAARPAADVARAPILSVEPRGAAIGVEALARVLSDTFGIMTRAGHHCAHPLHEALGFGPTLRASLAFTNTEDEVLQLRDALLALLRRGGAP